MIKDTPIRIAAKIGCPMDNPPIANDIIPRIIINTEAIFDIGASEIMPAIPTKISMIPTT